ncbi:hypothetical protein HDU99_003970, partial [Rhizoclosmatium hyalinum]
MTSPLPKTQLSLVAYIFLHYVVPVLEFIYGRQINMLEEEETCNLFETSNEIEAVFGPQDQVKRMTTELVKAVNTAPFCALGRFCAKEEMKKRAACRLAAMNYVITNPEIQSVKITAPLIVIGHPRSGTTLIQRLLACDPKARGFKMFEMTPALGSDI